MCLFRGSGDIDVLNRKCHDNGCGDRRVVTACGNRGAMTGRDGLPSISASASWCSWAIRVDSSSWKRT